MEDCIFCRIVKGEIPSKKVYEDDLVLAFEDIHPMAPVHIILIPKKHFATVMDFSEGEKDIIYALIHGAQEVAKKMGIAERGFRIAMNVNPEGGQVIFHVHLHVLGGRKLTDELG
ncbi:MAG TPA: histidine triad nucleotide-binding protein [Syntrophales bacterium]|nr:histidine triad nucleotide-binding protein [Syntrophales bacterium]HOL58355.1 histidine triad nucleotide-binding protein [Syntrophales bacterium]HPO34524.1 histidine triad nucleotide-binding protein [Syntrophales bacterium]